jgi:hypothetical protein
MTLRPPAHKELESAIEARLAAGEVHSPSHADHVQGCMSCAQRFDDLAGLAESTPSAPAGLNPRVLRAVIADQEQLRAAAAHQRTKGVITLTALRAILVIVAVTIATFSAGVWAASILGD